MIAAAASAGGTIDAAEHEDAHQLAERLDRAASAVEAVAAGTDRAAEVAAIAHVKINAALIWTDSVGNIHEIMNDMASWRRASWAGLAPGGPLPVYPTLRLIDGKLLA